MDLKNLNSIITGSNKGIGRETLIKFSEYGANIFACARNANDKNFKIFTNDLERKFNNKIFPIELDLSSKLSIKKASQDIFEKNLNIDVLVNNAAIIDNSLFQMTKTDKLKNLFEINFFSHFFFTQLILKKIIKNKSGSIIFVSSTSAIDGNIGRMSYSASKNAINSFSKTISRELGRYNIRVNTVSPGLTDTAMMQNNTPEEIKKEVLKNISLGRIAKPVEIAETISFLASKNSSYITGQNIRVDGGL